MKALQIRMDVAPYKTAPEHIARLRALGAPEIVIERAEVREELRSDVVREWVGYTGLKSVSWLPAYTELVGEEEHIYISYTGLFPPARLIAILNDLIERDVIIGYAACTIKDGSVYFPHQEYECPACHDQGCFRCQDQFQLLA